MSWRIMTQHFNGPRFTVRRLVFLVPLALSASLSPANDEKASPPQVFKHRITGLCCREREADLRETVEKMRGVGLIGIDFENAEAAFAYDPAKLFPQAKPSEANGHFHHLLASASFHTFGIKTSLTIPVERLTLLEIPVVGLDCKGCSLGAYESIYLIDGVEYATASFKDGRVTARIDPGKINLSALKAALKAKGVQLKD